MATKKIVQDIVPSKRRSIRDVVLNKDDEPVRKNSPHTAAFRAERGIRVPVHLEHAVASPLFNFKKRNSRRKKEKNYQKSHMASHWSRSRMLRRHCLCGFDFSRSCLSFYFVAITKRACWGHLYRGAKRGIA